METAKRNIKTIVDTYIQEYPWEFDVIKKAVQMKKKLNRDEFGTIEGSDMRVLFEIPDTLETNLILHLSSPEITWFKTIEGGRWFAKNFPVFALSEV